MHEFLRYEWAITETALRAAMSDYAIGRQPRGDQPVPAVDGRVAVLPIHGMITPRGTALDAFFGGTSMAGFEQSLDSALRDSSVGAILLDIDSPGGVTHGVESAADRIFAARGQGKPIIALANHEAGSAAYWLGSQADQLIAAPGADVGSIGAFRIHKDVSGALEKEGVKITAIGYPDRKTESLGIDPISDEAFSHHLEQVKHTYQKFSQAVARGRGVDVDTVDKQFGQGRVYHAETAPAGMVDRIATPSQVLSELLDKKDRSAAARKSRLATKLDSYSY